MNNTGNQQNLTRQNQDRYSPSRRTISIPNFSQYLPQSQFGNDLFDKQSSQYTQIWKKRIASCQNNPQVRKEICKQHLQFISQIQNVKFFKQVDQYSGLRSQNKSQLQSEILIGNLRDDKYDELLRKICPQQEQFDQIKIQLVESNICSYDDLMRIQQSIAERFCLESEQFKLMRKEYLQKEPEDQFPIFEVSNKKVKNDYPSINILVLGQTGAGKSSLINMIANVCILEDANQNFRVRLIKEDETKLYSESSTEKIQFYTIYDRKTKQQIVLIDSPGFADTKGIQADLQIAKDLQDLLSKELSQLNLICLVKKESDNKLDDLTKYILGNIFELFGNDVQKNLHLVLTYSSFIPTRPKVLNVFEDKKEFSIILNKMIEPKYSQFDLGDEIIYGKSLMDRYVKNVQSFQTMQKKIKDLFPKSLKLTQQVIITRLEIIQQIQLLKDMQLKNLNQLGEISKLFNLRNQEQKTIECIYIEKTPIQEGQFVTNCIVCNITCHQPCFIKRNDQKYFCKAIQRQTGNCKYCSCVWYFHQNNTYIIQLTKKTEFITQKLQEPEQLIQNYKKQVALFYVTQQELINLFQQINDNALLPDSFSCMKGYFGLMIEAENRSKQVGYEERINTINNLQYKYQMMQGNELKQEVLQQQLNPLMEYVDVRELKILLESDYNKLRSIYQD